VGISKGLALASAILGAALVASAGAWAQPVLAPPVLAAAPADEYDVLFQRMLKEPQNLDITFRFAELAGQRGDYEAAIGALERMLFYNRELPRVKAELGALYFRLGSYEMARNYFLQVIATPGVPGDVRAKVDGFLAEIARRESPVQTSVFVWMGARYQTNANAGPDSALVRVLGQDAVLAGQFTKQPDWNSFIMAVAGFSYDLGNQRGDTIEAGIVGYYSKQFIAEQFDLGVFEVQVGPRFAILPERISGASLKVYGIANTVLLGGPQYFNTVGAGVSARFNAGAFAVVEPSFEYRQRDFFNSANYPTAALQTGHLMTTAIAAEGATVWTKWVVRGAFDRNDAQTDFNSYDRWSVDAGIPIEFTAQLFGPRQFVVTPTGGFSWAHYVAPDPLVDPFVVRVDREWRVGAIVDAQIYQNIGVRTQVQYQKVNSNIPNFDLDNFSVSFGPTLRF
jgi:hypothetical protein